MADKPILVSEDQLRSLPDPDIFSLTMEHFQKNHQIPEDECLNRFTECLKYLYLVSACRDRVCNKFFPLTAEVDEFWHYLIIQTREYQDLCQKLPGGFFIHHRSISFREYQKESGDRAKVAGEFLGWIPLYVQYFGCFDDRNSPCWIPVSFLVSRVGMGLSELNMLGKTGI